jgi:hypothetical protein
MYQFKIYFIDGCIALFWDNSVLKYSFYNLIKYKTVLNSSIDVSVDFPFRIYFAS